MRLSNLRTLQHPRGVFLSIAALAAVSLLASSVFATPLNRGSYVGTNVTYIDVTEDSATDPALIVPGPSGGLFGEPTVSGDGLDFNPKNFAAFASGALGIDHTDANLQFLVQAHTGQGISGLALSESGDTTLAGLSGDAYTAVTATIFVEITELVGPGGSFPVAINLPAASMTFTPSGGSFQMSVDGTGPSTTFAFAGNAYVDLGPYVPMGTAAKKISVSLDNTLVAISEDGTSAFIQKKDFDGLSVTINTLSVPEPTSGLLTILGIGLAALGRKRS
jgi:hypothetical protein